MQLKKVNKNFYLSLFIAIIYFGILYNIGIYYDINDDLTIRRILSGEYAGTPSAYVYGVNIVLCYILKTLYSWIPQVDFFGGLLVFCYFYLLLMILTIALNRVQGIKKKIFSVILVLSLFSCLFVYNILFVTFTSSAIVCGIISVLHGVSFLGKTENKYGHLFASGLWIILAFCVRQDVFLMCFPFIAWILLIIGRKEYKTVILFMSLTIVGVFILSSIHTIKYSSVEWENYISFRDGRKVVHDYTGFPLYDANPSFYEELGISYEEYSCFREAQVNTVLDYSVPMVDVYNKIIENYMPEKTIDSFMNSASYFISNTLASNMRKIWIGMDIILSILLIYRMIKRKEKIGLLCYSGIIALLAMEYIYLIYRGRYTNTVMNGIILLWAAIIFIVIFLVENWGNRRLSCSISLAISIVFFVSISPELITRVNYYQKMDSSTDIVNEYCKSNPEKCYAGPAFFMAGVTDQIKINDDMTFENRIVMGGWNALSLTYYAKLENCGIDTSLENAIMTNPNVYVISSESCFKSIESYLSTKYVGYCMSVVDSFETPGFGEIFIYDIGVQ